ncbi:exocyst complex component Sec5-domain-containing protein [Fimicolochytrium jonesii]|uniref:exocyst complex component Sec5-domain-containing protein n=1 Tax=Fimicolochytrium jonesii TaxID=1396493 RepID=UPI0022FE6675|nr:exocyst complex component Sec5-domain-containing protein [Fimicolochytrium jonesii]KAI8825748.1 exocyst complex component Sec5-domain-containing protein [Fimicolochytrium jonesii]
MTSPYGRKSTATKGTRKGREKDPDSDSGSGSDGGRAPPPRKKDDSGDDSDSDGDDDRASGYDDPKRPDVRWTAEEQDAVMDFYGLQTLYPQSWLDTRDKFSSSRTGLGDDESLAESLDDEDKQSPKEAAGTGEDDGPIDTSDPLAVKDSILGARWRRGTVPRGNEQEQFAQLLISSRKFDAKHFLREVHKTTTYDDLEVGAEHLRQAIDHKEDVIKNLVKTHFAKFVSAKSTIDSFYDQMRTKNLISSDEYGVAPFAKSIEALQVDAGTLYNPLLQRRVQAAKIRSTLAVLGQWKFFFNLPSVLQGYAKKAKYDALVRDYQKGKYLMHSSFGENSQRRTALNSKEKDALLPQHHQAVFEKVWSEVESIVAQARQQLFLRLSEPWLALDVQERNMTFLIELGAETDPVHVYLDKQYQWIVERLRKAYRTHLRTLDELAKTFQDARQPVFTLPNLRKALNIVKSQEFEQAFAEDTHVQLFKATQRLVRALCNVLLDCLPDFWRLCKIYSGSKLQKPKNFDSAEAAAQSRMKRRLDSKKLEHCQSYIRNILDLFSKSLARAFYTDTPLSNLRAIIEADVGSSADLSSHIDGDVLQSPEKATGEDIPPPPTGQTGSILTPAPPLPPPSPIPFRFASFLHSHPLTASYFFIKIMGELTRCFGEIRAIRIVGNEQLMIDLAAGMDRVKVRATEVVCDGMLEESRTFHMYEDWSFDHDMAAQMAAQGPGIRASTSENALANVSSIQSTWRTNATANDATNLLKLFYRLHHYIMRCLQRIAAAPISVSDDAGAGRDSVGTAMGRPNASVASAGPLASPTSPGGLNIERHIPHNILVAIKAAFNASMFAMLDGLQWLATSWTPALMASASQQAADGRELASPESLMTNLHNRPSAVAGSTAVLSGAFGGGDAARATMGNAPIWKNKSTVVDVEKAEVRILIVLSNLSYMRKFLLPKLGLLFEDRFGIVLSSDMKNLQNTLNDLDSLLFRNYVKRTAASLRMIIRDGILFEGMDWSGLSKPQEVRPYVFRGLLLLVAVHAQVSGVSRALVVRVLEELTIVLASDVLDSVRQVERFNWGGMLQATLEIQFLDQTLTAYSTSTSSQLLTLAYDTIERGHESEKSDNTTGDKDDLFKKVKTLLADAKRATEVQFSCFKEQKGDEKGVYVGDEDDS